MMSKAIGLGIFLFGAATLLLGADTEATFDRTLSVSGQVNLDLKTDSGGITVRRGSSNTVRIHGILKSGHGWLSSGDVEARMRELAQHPPIEQNGSTIRVGYTHGRDLLKDISMRLEIETPSATQLRAEADSGGIAVEGIAGPVDCKTDSGGIQIRDVPANIHATVDSGGIHIRNAGPVFARADSGGIEATDIKGSIDAAADSGSIRLTQTTPAPISAKAESGAITLALVRGAGYDVQAQTDSGSVSAPEMTVHGSLSPHHLEGKIGDGGPLVKVHADSGSVSIE